MNNDPVTKAEFLAWAQTKTPEEPYDYISNSQCPMAQFLREVRGWPNPRANGIGFYNRNGDTDSNYHRTTLGFEKVLSGNRYYENREENFGALVKRLEACPDEVLSTPVERN